MAAAPDDGLATKLLQTLTNLAAAGSGGDKPPEDPNKPALPLLDTQSSASDPPGLDAKTPEQIARDAAAAVAATQSDTGAVAAGHEGVPFPATSDATAAPSADQEAARVDNSGWEFLLQDNARVEAAKAKWLADTKDNPLWWQREATTEPSVSPFDADREPPQNTRGSASEPPADTSQRHTVDNTSAEALQKMKR